MLDGHEVIGMKEQGGWPANAAVLKKFGHVAALGPLKVKALEN